MLSIGWFRGGRVALALVAVWLASGVVRAADAASADTISVSGAVTNGPYKPTWESLSQYECPTWFRDAKFGIWAVWSPQSVPGQGDWYAKHLYEEGSDAYRYHVEHYGHPTQVGYKDICNLWKAENWDPAALVRRYRQAGAKYLVVLANHHCNFDCWDSTFQPWNSVNVGPKKDIVGMWLQAAREEGMRFGVSVHAARTWSWFEVAHGADKQGPRAGQPYDGRLTQADGVGTWWEGYDPQDLYGRTHESGGKPDQAYVDRFFNRVRDLLQKYRPDLLYFDDSVLPLNGVSDAGMRIAMHYYNSGLQWRNGNMDVVMTTKNLSPEQRAALTWDIERGRSERLQPHPWQSDTCLGGWHYSVPVFENHKYKTATTVVTTLVDVISKNGNLLLNVPLKADGTLDADEVRILDEIGAWMTVNGGAVYGTRPWVVFGEGAADVATGNFGEAQARPYTADDIRFTASDDAIYAFVLGWPDKPVLVRSMGQSSPLVRGEVAGVQLLGSTEKVVWSRGADALQLEVPGVKPCEHACAFRITGLRTVQSADTRNLPWVPQPLAPPETTQKAHGVLYPGADGAFRLEPDQAVIKGNMVVESRSGTFPNLGRWNRADEYVTWKVRFTKTGTYAVTALASAASGASDFVVEVGSEKVTGKIAITPGWAAFKTLNLGKVTVSAVGETVVKVRPRHAVSWNPICLAWVNLAPAE